MSCLKIKNHSPDNQITINLHMCQVREMKITILFTYLVIPSQISHFVLYIYFTFATIQSTYSPLRNSLKWWSLNITAPIRGKRLLSYNKHSCSPPISGKRLNRLFYSTVSRYNHKSAL